MDLNRPDCGPAAGRSSRRLRLGPDSFGQASPREIRGQSSGTLEMGVPLADAGSAGRQAEASARFLINSNQGVQSVVFVFIKMHKEK